MSASSNLSGLLASDVAKGAIRDHESTGSLTPPRSASPSLDHRDNEVFSSKVEYEPVRNTNSVSYEPRPSWSSSDSERSGGEKRPSRMSASHVPAWYKDMQKGVEVPVQKIEEPESYLVQRRPAYGEKSSWCFKADFFALWFYQTSPFKGRSQYLLKLKFQTLAPR